MEKDLKMKVEIQVESREEQLRIGNSIHECLVGNPDYVNNSIILNIDDPNIIRLFIFKECETIPTIVF